MRKAADLLGGREKLAKVLQVPDAEIDRWIADEGRPPRDIFLRIVDLILDESSSASDTDPQEPPPPRDAAGSSRRYLD